MGRYVLFTILFAGIILITGCAGKTGKTAGQDTDAAENEKSILPAGYKLVWADEFNSGDNGSMPDPGKWWYETGGGGWGNNELQYYVPGIINDDTLAFISDGVLHIKAIRMEQPIDGYNYASIRMNSSPSWLYGYFEARIKLPKGHGTWPAFWMLPEDFKAWPIDGEIDIMEHAGNAPGQVHITVHTQSNNHSKNTQITSISEVENAQDEFHVYGLEWTKDFIKGYIDGDHKYTFENDGKNQQESWPFNKPFYLKLNMALGGFFSDQHTVDDNVLPAIYEIDYVRVYQKK